MSGKHVNPSCAPKDKRQQAGGPIRKSGRMIAALLLTILAFGIGYAVFTSASAATVASGKCGGSAEWALTKDGTLTISGTGAMEDYKYPANPEWYDHKDMIKTVIFSDGITDIGYGVFDDCTALTEVTIPDSVTSIDNFTFPSCDSLTDIDVSQGNEAYCSIDGVLFNKSGSELICFPSGRTGSYTIPDSVTNIGYGAFGGCAALTEITIPDSVTYIGYGAFSGCTGLTEINIPNSVVIIDNIVFCGCTGLTEINIPDSVTSIGSNAFLYCDKLSDVYYDGSESDWGRIEIGFLLTTDLENTNIHYNSAMPAQGAGSASAPAQNPAATIASGKCGGSAEWVLTKDGTLTISGTGAMEDYDPGTSEWDDYKDMIKTVIISDGITNIGTSAFFSCMFITDITIPDSLTNIGFAPFFGCDSLVNIYVGQGNEVYSSIDGVLFNKTASELVCFPEGRTGSYTIPDSVTSIAANAFNCCSSLTEIFIPASVTSIGDAAFLCCDKLSDVYYGGSESDWQKIEIGFLLSGLENANIHYNASA